MSPKQSKYIFERRKMEHAEARPETFGSSIVEFFKKVFDKKKKMPPPTDPMEALPEKAISKIFEYCSGNDLLNFSLVTRKWYSFVAKSEMCMNKIKINITEPRIGFHHLFSQNDLFILTESGRKYVHISLSNIDRYLQPHHKLLLAHFKWKSVSLKYHTFRNKMEFINFLGIFEPFVEELTICNVKHGNSIYEIARSNFIFPKLLKLSIVNCYTFVYGDAFCKTTTLRCLNIVTESLPNYISDKQIELTKRMRAIQTIFLNNPRICYLEMFIHQDDFDQIFLDQRFLCKIRFSLHSFYVGKFKQVDEDGSNIVQISNFVRFLRSQVKTMRILYLENWLGNATLEYAINDMDLQDLTIANLGTFGRHNESIASLSLWSNETIEHLSIWTESVKHIYLNSEILKVCRALRVLEIRTINQATLETLIEYNEDLEIIVCDFFTAYMPPSRPVFHKIKSIMINIVCADNFRDLILYKQCYTPFEKLFLKAAERLKDRWSFGTNYNF